MISILEAAECVYFTKNFSRSVSCSAMRGYRNDSSTFAPDIDSPMYSLKITLWSLIHITLRCPNLK
jgi:hypothetical protein